MDVIGALLFGVLAIIVGLVAMLSIGIRLWLIRRLGHRGRATGTVVGHVIANRPSQPTVEFIDRLGNRFRFPVNHLSCRQAPYGALPVGRRVEIAYLPADPRQARLSVDTGELGLGSSWVSRFAFYCHRHFIAPEPWVRTSMMFQEDLIRQRIRAEGLRATGTVVRNDPWQNPIPRPHRCTKVRYETRPGETVDFIEASATVIAWHRESGREVRTFGLPAIGKQVRVVYLPESPRVAIVDDFRTTVVDLVIRVVGGSLVIALGWALIVFAW